MLDEFGPVLTLRDDVNFNTGEFGRPEESCALRVAIRMQHLFVDQSIVFITLFPPAALHMAAVKTQRSGPMVQLLIARGHMANVKNRYGWTALDFAKQVSSCLHEIHPLPFPGTIILPVLMQVC